MHAYIVNHHVYVCSSVKAMLGGWKGQNDAANLVVFARNAAGKDTEVVNLGGDTLEDRQGETAMVKYVSC